MSIEEIAKKCHTRIAANNGFFDEKYFVDCIVDAINEAIASQQSVQADGGVCTCKKPIATTSTQKSGFGLAQKLGA